MASAIPFPPFRAFFGWRVGVNPERKRTSHAKSKRPTDEADTSFNPADFDPAMPPEAAAFVQQVADTTATPQEHCHASQHAPTGSGQAVFSETRRA